MRGYQDGDESGIVRLFNEVFPQKITLEHWRWKYAENPAGFPYIGLALDGQVVVGHRSYIPTRFYFQGKLVRAAQASDLMVHASYRRKGIIRQIVNFTHQQLEASGDISFVFAFPMPHVESMIKHLTGFETAFPVPKMVKVRNPMYLLKRLLYPFPSLQRRCRLLGIAMLKHRPPQERFQRPKPIIDSRVKPIHGFDWRADRLCESGADRHAVMRLRDAQYLNWRYGPSRYRKLAFFDREQLKGFIVVTINSWQGWTAGHIVDVLATDSPSLRALLGAALDYLANQEVDVFRCWMSPSSMARPELARLGFISRPAPNNMLVGVYDQEIDNDILLNAEHWYLTHGDVDSI